MDHTSLLYHPIIYIKWYDSSPLNCRVCGQLLDNEYCYLYEFRGTRCVGMAGVYCVEKCYQSLYTINDVDVCRLYDDHMVIHKSSTIQQHIIGTKSQLIKL